MQRENSREKKLVKNTAVITFGSVCTKCVSFMLLPLYTTILSTTEYGTVDLINTYVSLLVVILTLQMEQGLFQFLVEARDNLDRIKRNISSTIRVLLIVVFIFGIVSLLLYSVVKFRYGIYLIIWAISLCINAIFVEIPRGLDDNWGYTIANLISGITNVILNVLFIAILGWKVPGMLCANIIAIITSVFFVFFRVKLWRWVDFRLYDKEYISKLMKFSMPMIPHTLCWWVIGVSDRFFINTYLGASQIGIYSIAYKFSTLFSLVTGFFQTAWIASAAENSNDNDSSGYYQFIIRRMTQIYSSGNLCIIAVIPLLFNVFIKNEFVYAYNYIPILLTSAMLHAVSSLYGAIFLAKKRTVEISKTAYIAAFINVLINLGFIKYIGLWATSISTLVAYLVALVVRHIKISNEVEINYGKQYLTIELIFYLIVMSSYYKGSILFKCILAVVTIARGIALNKEVFLKMIRKKNWFRL